VQFARRLGASVEIISKVGHGCPDALVGFRGSNLIWEFKRPGEPGKRVAKRQGGKLKEKQQRFVDTWMGKVETIETPEDVIRSLLRADTNRTLDCQEVSDDFLAHVVKAVRSNPLMAMDVFSKAEATPSRGRFSF